MPERAGRAGDTQGMPKRRNDMPYVHDLVAHDLLERQRLGVRRYGQPLQPANGRDALLDLYEELLDSVCYLRQAIEERDRLGLPGFPK